MRLNSMSECDTTGVVFNNVVDFSIEKIKLLSMLIVFLAVTAEW